MKKATSSAALLSTIAFFAGATVFAQDVANGGFENGTDGWNITDPGDAVALSSKKKSGKKSIHLTAKGALVDQVINVTPNTHYEVTAYMLGQGLIGVKVQEKIYFDRTKNPKRWQKVRVRFDSADATTVSLFGSFSGGEVRLDDFTIENKGPQTDQELSATVISRSAGGSGLSPDLPPGNNFDLLGWNLSVPTDTDGNGKSDTISEVKLASGYEDENFFYTGPDGGMVFKTPIYGYKTSKNTTYTRTELREMLRRGDTSISTRKENGAPNKNNWVFSSAPQKAQDAAGAVDGRLEATLAINHVTTTGERSQVGRVIVGQIHAKNDEPIRLYYRKMPGNTRGSIYAAHESLAEKDDIYYEIIGARAPSTPDPENGFALNEKWSYVIDAKGNFLYVTIKNAAGEIVGETTIDMTNSGYDVEKDYMYFKAGVYNQNKSGDEDDYVQATFYKLKATH